MPGIKTYVAQWDYRSSYGQFKKESEYELTEAQAEMFNRDSPGVLQEKASPKKTPVVRQAKVEHNR